MIVYNYVGLGRIITGNLSLASLHVQTPALALGDLVRKWTLCLQGNEICENRRNTVLCIEKKKDMVIGVKTVDNYFTKSDGFVE